MNAFHAEGAALRAKARFVLALDGTAEQLAEKVDVAVAFGWRSGLPLR
ncbi:MAG TPA: hypothetical protein VJX69_04640 [Terriglobales bacterium]|nr:hypothetical protein [Terriglobales bacterium]